MHGSRCVVNWLPSPADEFFDRLDVNGDDVITADDIPERMRPLVKLLGVKIPEKGMPRKELTVMFEKMQKVFSRPKPAGKIAPKKKPAGQGREQAWMTDRGRKPWARRKVSRGFEFFVARKEADG